MTPDETSLINARNGYNYPRVFLMAVRGWQVKGEDHPAPAAPEQVDGTTQDQWEARHRQLLHSADIEESILGLLSIAYWGFYGSATPGRRVTPERALARAKFARDGRPTAKRVLPFQAIHGQLRLASQALDCGEISTALLAINKIQEFGQVSFASKVLAAMSPEQCGVYDRVIYEAIKTSEPIWHQYAAHPNQGMSRVKARTYQRWCELLTRRANMMNQHGLLNSGWLNQHQRRAWRPVDVERGFFHSKDVAVLGMPV